jgi:hypothetical protein
MNPINQPQPEQPDRSAQGAATPLEQVSPSRNVTESSPGAPSWLQVGQRFSDGRREEILIRAGQLHWCTVNPGERPRGPFSPLAALQQVIVALQITGVRRLGWGPTLDYADLEGPDTVAYGLLGIEQLNTAGDIGQLILLDTGSLAVPLYWCLIPAGPPARQR